jgi:hypothetical protein
MALGALVSSKFHLAFEITKPVPFTVPSGILLRIHSRPQQCRERRLQLRHLICHKYLLWHIVCVQPRGPSVGSPRHRKWHSISFNRCMGIVSALVATYGNTATSVPIFICAALFVAMAAVSVLFPFEPEHAQST